MCVNLLKINRNYEQKVFEIIKKLYNYKSSKFLYLEYSDDDSWEREEISVLLKDIYSQTSISSLKKDITDYILQTFNIVEDEGKFWHFTPPQLFEILKEYISNDPEKNILWFADKTSEQYQKYYQKFGKKIIFEGWEHIGGGIAQSGSEFSIDDRNFISKIIEPVLHQINNTDEKWKFVKAKLITIDQDKVSYSHPDFLNRSCINYLLNEYVNGSHSLEAFEILTIFIKMRKGIPWKPDLIFQAVRNGNFSEKQQWNLIKVSLDAYKQLPVNVFVEQIVTELANSDKDDGIQKLAIQTITDWSKNPDYRKNRSWGSYDVIDSVFRLLNNPKTFSNGVDIFQIHVNSSDFINNSDTYGSWGAGNALALIIQINTKVGIQLLEEIYNHDPLSKNQQLIICSALDDIPDKKQDLQVDVYEKFINPKLEELSTIENIEAKFTHSHARELLIRYSEKLAKFNEYKKSLRIVKMFISDSDPSKDGSNSIDDPEGKFNKHKQIISGKKDFSIDTVRGQCAWTLRHFATLKAHDYIDDAFLLVKQLAVDPNYYVRLQSTFPLTEFVRNRNSYLPEIEPKVRFMSENTARDIEDTIFSMLRNKKNQQLIAIMKGLVHAFGNMRTIDSKRAFEALSLFVNTGNEDILHDVAPLIVFFSEFRKTAFNKWVWGKLPEFDDSKFKELLKNQILHGEKSIKQSISWEFWRLPDEGRTDKSLYNKDLFLKSVNYLKVFTEGEYDHNIWEHIYHFVEDYLQYEFKPCFELWSACILKEKPALIELVKDKDKIYEINWWPFFYNGRILLAIDKNLEESEFIKWLDILTDYPSELYIANDLSDVVERMKKLPKNNEQIDKVFDKLIKRNPAYYDAKVEWLNK